MRGAEGVLIPLAFQLFSKYGLMQLDRRNNPDNIKHVINFMAILYLSIQSGLMILITTLFLAQASSSLH